MKSHESRITRELPASGRYLQDFLHMTATAALCALLIGQPAQADEPVKMFNQLPTPGVLADTLFPVQYRSIKFNNVAQEESASQTFGMLINFEYDSTAIVDDSLPYLDSVGQMLLMEDVQDRAVMIEGHADASGAEGYNMTLSVKRAAAIKEYIVGTYGINPDRLVVSGKGEQELLDQTDPYAAINRRVQFSAAN